MLTAIFIMQCLLLLIGFLVYWKKEEPHGNPNINLNTNPNTVSDRDIHIFRSGLQQQWMLITIALYKMYVDLDILDFDNMQTVLQKTIDELSADQSKMKEWAEKFQSYASNDNRGKL